VFSVQSFSYLFLSAQSALILLKISRFNTFCVFSVHSYLAAACALCRYFVVNKPHVAMRLQALQAAYPLSLLRCYSLVLVKRL
jgi:hypothetical protein